MKNVLGLCSVVAVAIVAGACAGTGEFGEPSASDPPPIAAQPNDPQQPSAVVDAPGDLLDPRRSEPRMLVVRNFNLTVQVADPGGALDRARAAIIKAGGEITNADRNADHGSLSAVVRREHSGDVFKALHALGVVNSESENRNDMRAAMHDLRRRIRRQELSHATLQQVIRESTDRAVVDALLLQLELSQRERQSMRQQENSYRQQGRGDQFHLTLSRAPGAAAGGTLRQPLGHGDRG